MLPNADTSFSDAAFDIEDEAYADVVRTVLDEEISRGEGSNFVIKRSFVASITLDATSTALTLFRRLLSCETGAYWTLMNRSIKEATLKRFHYDCQEQLRTHLADFIAAYNFARRLTPPQRPHAIRAYLQGLELRAGSAHPQPDPPNAGTEHLCIV